MTTVPTMRDPPMLLGNTLALLARLDAALREVALFGQPLTILQLDFDRFADFNARYGRGRGDALLAGFANFLREFAALREDVAAGRAAGEAFHIGGDGFVIILPTTNRLRARRLAAALLSGAEAAGIGLSIGIGVAETGATDLGTLLMAADGALRAVKARGGGRARLLTEAPLDAVGASGVIAWLARHALDMQQLLAEANRLALTDPLTGLPNQRALQQFLAIEMPRTIRHEHPLALLLIDGDDLRAFNSRFGYAAGDDWIRTLGAVLAGETRGGDLTVRWRVGDEFVVALPETTREAAVLAAERIRAAIAGEVAALPIQATVSIGLASFPEDGRTAEALLARAEEANRRAKRLGKNRIAFVGGEPGPTRQSDTDDTTDRDLIDS